MCVCVCERASHVGGGGAGSAPNWVPFQPDSNCCHFLGNPTSTSEDLEMEPERLTPGALSQGRSRALDLPQGASLHSPLFCVIWCDFQN